MAADRRRQALLVVLGVALVVLMYRAWPSGTSGTPAQPSNQTGPRATGRGAAAAITAPDVRLDALDAERPKPAQAERNLFRFKSGRSGSAAPGARGGEPAAPAAPPPTMPPAAPAIPPIALKFIGVVDAPGGSPRIAVLSDGRNVFHGREGDIIEGRYRIVSIGAESIELSYLDGRGRQSIRLSGS